MAQYAPNCVVVTGYEATVASVMWTRYAIASRQHLPVQSITDISSGIAGHPRLESEGVVERAKKSPARSVPM
jgi:hypothetical protein